MYENITSYLGKCRCSVCACMCVLTCTCVVGGGVIFNNITSYPGPVLLRFVCMRVCSNRRVCVLMAEPLCLRASVAAVCARACACVFLPARVSMTETLCLKT